MFRGVHYVTMDYMLYIQDGWITFAYWKPQFVKDSKTNNKNQSNDNSELNSPSNLFIRFKIFLKIQFYFFLCLKEVKKRTARLNIFLYNFQLHYYNSWKFNSDGSLATSNNNNNSNSNSNSNRASNNNKTFTSQHNIFNSSLFVRTFSNSIFNFLTGGSNNHSNNTNINVDNVDNINNTSKSNLVNNNNNINNANSNDYNFTEDLMQLFSVVNIKIQKVFLNL